MLPYSFDMHWNYACISIGPIDKQVTFYDVYFCENSENCKYVTATKKLKTMVHEFYSENKLSCIKVELIISSSHLSIIQILLTECKIMNTNRLVYYSTLNEQYAGFDVPESMNTSVTH